MGRQQRVVDAALAGSAFAATVAVLAAGGLGVPDPHTRALDVVGWLLAAAGTLPLVARRRYPMAVYAVVVAAAALLGVLRYPYDFPFGALVAVFTLAVAYGAPGPRRLQAMVAAAVFVPAVAALLLAVGRSPRGILPGLVFWAVLVVGAWIAGDRGRLRGEQLVELRARAERTERAAEQDRRLAAAQERTRIARELHDSAGHTVNVILVQAGAARLLHPQDPVGARRALDTVESVARDLIGEIDQLVHVLRDDPAAETPADPGRLDELIAGHERAGLRIAADVRGEADGLPRSVAWATYRIVQEALTNAARHGDGRAELVVRYRPESVDIEVRNPVRRGAAARKAGHGIVGMTERAHLLGGTFQAGDGDGGWRLRASLPRPGRAP